MLNCIAVDDEPLALSLLADNISKVPYLNLVTTCDDAFEALKALQQNRIDLIFIDIQMPGLTGLQFIESLSQKPMVIFITAYKQYALESYNLDVVDYLVKPVPLERFMKACNKAFESYHLKSSARPTEAQPAADYFFINADYSLVKVLFTDILYIEGLRDYVKIHLKSSGRPIVTRMSMKSIEEQVPGSKFVRIHKSYLVSVDSISVVKKNSVSVKEHELPVGETYRDVIARITGKGNNE